MSIDFLKFLRTLVLESDVVLAVLPYNILQLFLHMNARKAATDRGARVGAVRYIKPDITKDDQLQYPDACKKEGIAALMSIPIIFKDKIVGVLRLYNSEVRDFTNREIEFMTAIAEQGGIAIQNARVMKQLKKDHKREIDDLWNWFSDFSDKSGY